MKAFRVSGKFYMGNCWQNFTKEVAGDSDAQVIDKVLSELGSKHRVKRAKIKISEVMEISEKEVTDSITKFILENKGDFKTPLKEDEPKPKQLIKATITKKVGNGTKILKKRKAKKGEGNE